MSVTFHMNTLSEKIYSRLLFPLLFLLVCGAAGPAAAMPAETYAASSKLASGKWVKVSVPGCI